MTSDTFGVLGSMMKILDLISWYNKYVHWLPPMHKSVLGADILEGVL